MGWLSKPFGEKRSAYEVDETYLGLRSRVFDLADEEGEGLRAFLMDSGMDGGCFSLVAVDDGTLSLYLSSGGGLLGTGAWRVARQLGAEVLQFAANERGHFEDAEEHPLPAPGECSLHLVEPGRILRACHPEQDLGHNRLPLSPLFHRAHHLLATIRRVGDAHETDSTLVFAALMGETELLQGELSRGGNPNSTSSKGQPALLAAIGARQEATMSQLLDAGADVDTRDSEGNSALHIAGLVGAAELFPALLAAGAGVESREESAYTPLMMAANAGQKECVRALLKAGADANAEDNECSTPIMFAAQHGHIEIVRDLLNAGADPAFTGQHGLNAIAFAEQNGHEQTIHLLRG